MPSLTEARETISLLQVFFEAMSHSVGCKLILDTEKTLDELSTERNCANYFRFIFY